MSENINATVGNPLILGACRMDDGVNFSFSVKGDEDCSLILYNKKTTEVLTELPFTEDMRFGNVYSMLVHGISPADVDYNFSVNGEIAADEYAMALNNRNVWGKKPEDVTCSIVCHENYDWKNDRHPCNDFSDSIIYRMHVRGFTMGDGSGAKHKGTFSGIIEKIPYLKELGITLIELMPAYDFNETADDAAGALYMHTADSRINYWGYTDANYFAPKASYAFSNDSYGPENEFKDMVKALHAENIEVSMEFYFTADKSPDFILNCLRYWVLNYHIDGIHLNCSSGVMEMAERDAILAKTKFFSYGFNTSSDYYNETADRKRFGIFNDDFMITARKFLKGDEGMTGAMASKVRLNPSNAAVVNYIANHGTFTLADTVAYDRKHNEANGEGNRDGADYNYSWNCGVEGSTRKIKVLNLRKKQIKNALAYIFLSQGVPMIFAGDERGNSSMGNNNAYCQDNEISWTSWNNNAFSKEILSYTKAVIKFRKEHKILHMKNELKGMDYKSLGYPDISYHGSKAWYSDFDHVNRHFSVMYCGKYAGEKCDIYVAYNAHWDDKEFGVPTPPDGKKWEVAFSTDKAGALKKGDKVDKYCMVAGRSVAILVAF